MISPSTHAVPSRSIQPLIFPDSTETGHGASTVGASAAGMDTLRVSLMAPPLVAQHGRLDSGL
ncbi:hypothetical protein BC477_02110 [Clavibacter michiganensis subsp. michiganensis]|uniref:Uncharacterized protein n=1 Tax=Clavibacter michiganensis subsp. michiganensis TaxID=33013 RepID=A0A251XIW4_CLAMM|nr:hypothetical protein BC477_02110 [Clavibacter michiganensis subsp. michiganensis]OUE03504.1 hypothetical protein CMMCAS07_01045 [Clavibacter michiganensis subsp. michiganensis]